MKHRERYTVTAEADRIAPDWLAVRINYDTVNFIYSVVDGAVKLKGVRIGHEIAKIGDVEVRGEASYFLCQNATRLKKVCGR